MGNNYGNYMKKLCKSGNDVYERVVELPMWNDFDEDLKSPIADLKNLGGKYGGAITAGMFLKHFTDAPFIHLDIAGIAFNESKSGYMPEGGTGAGVRLLVNFLKHECERTD